jgi:sulfite reductase alpha subunit-like flavoprotein
MLLFGPGTGASPFLSFIEHKFYSWVLQSILIQKNNNVTVPQYFNQHLLKTNIDLYQHNTINNYYNNNVQIETTETCNKSTLTVSSKLINHNDEIINQYGNITLFSGNRYRDKDFLYGKHWLDHLSTNGNGLNKLHSIFSREYNLNQQQSEQEKSEQQQPLRYVQDLIQINGKEICQHVLNGGFIYVCGDGVVGVVGVSKVGG